MIKKIPDKFSVDASDYIAPQLSNRKIIQIFPEKCDADYLIWEQERLVNGGKNYANCLKKIEMNYIYIFKNGTYYIAKRK